MSTIQKWHPKPADHAGSSDARHDFMEVWKFPCCKQIIFSDIAPSQEQENGCQVKN